MLVFQPRRGNNIIGQISKVCSYNNYIYKKNPNQVEQISDNHISLLVCGMFNASILESELIAKYSYNEISNSW